MKAVVAASARRTALSGQSHKLAVFNIWTKTPKRSITSDASRSVSSASSITARPVHAVQRKFYQQRRQQSSARHDEPTIYALSTATGRAAIAVVRVSGPACLQIYRALCPGKTIPKPRYATLRTLYVPNQPTSADSILDSNALVFYYPAPRSATGEDVLELHIHGGTAIVKAVLSSIPQCISPIPSNNSTITTRPIIRYAEPGEFTRRAFLNSRLDLTQVEALSAVLSATTEQQRRLSVRGTTNALSQAYERWRRDLLYARGELEALIDFSEDQHFDESPAQLCASVAGQVLRLKAKLLAHSRNAVRGELLRNGISIALLGAPNVGKSSLLNRIVGREAAIVSQEAGTTRDVVEVGVDLGGYFCRLGDTAGLRTQDHDRGVDVDPTVQAQRMIGQIEREGMKRSRQRAAESDVVIVVLSLEDSNGTVQLQLDPEVITTATKLVHMKDNVHVLINKADLSPDGATLDTAVQVALNALPGIARDRIHIISCRNAEVESANPSDAAQSDPGGIQAFLRALIDYFASLTAAVSADTVDDGSDDPSIWQDSLGASERHRLLLLECIAQLDAFLLTVGTTGTTSELSSTEGEAAGEEADIVLAAEHLRSAADCLAKITGRGGAGDVEEVLGVVFEKFCVGK